MKDAYYFPHDSNARNDQRLLRVRMKYGMEGYGIYFGIIEILREQSDYKLGSCQFESIAFDLRVDVKKVEDIVMGEFVLFEWDSEYSEFWSTSLKRRMEKLDLIKQKRSEAGRLGGKSSGKSKASAKAKVKHLEASKVKESRLDKNTVKQSKTNIEFEKFWNLYNYKVGSKSKVLKKWESLNDLDRGMIMEHLPHYIKSTPDKQFRKHPATYLNNQGWFDEIVVKTNGVIDFKLDSTGNFYMGYCDKCNKSSFYKKEDIYGDSRCCNSKLLNERKKDDKESN